VSRPTSRERQKAGASSFPLAWQIQWPSSWAIVKRCLRVGVSPLVASAASTRISRSAGEHPRALAQVALLDPQAEEVLGDRLDRRRELDAAERGEVLGAALVGAWVGVPGRD
jgi:hypothetical protein